MFNMLSKEARKIWNLMESTNKEVYGTGDLLKVLINLDDGMFSVILKENNISIVEVNEYIDNTMTIDNSKDRYSKKLLEVYDYAKSIALINQEQIYEEHLIYALIKTKDTTAYSILCYYIKDLDSLACEYNEIFDLEPVQKSLTNLTKLMKVKKETFVGKEKLVKRVINVLHKKKKNNPLLIGSAGVGKSSLVEEVARYYLRHFPEYTIYQLDIAEVISGTKYRGDLEGKLLEVIDCIKKPYTILFIDEIHNITKTSEDSQSVDIGNMLKPILSRGDITLIGATTLDEYYSTINNDKALARRFTNVFIDEASETESYHILKGIKKSYEKHHKVKYPDKILKYIVLKSKLILNRYLPDKAIDILDEAGLYAKEEKLKEVSVLCVDRVVFSYLGQDILELTDNLNKKLNISKLKYYINNYVLGVMDKKTIANFRVHNKSTTKLIIDDLKKIFNLKDEMILSINMTRYKTTIELSNLFGTSKGYVGYNSGGIISEHLIKYPFSVLVIKNLSQTSTEVISYIESIIKSGEFTDSKSRKIILRNTFIIFEEDSTFSPKLGFVRGDNKTSDQLIDEDFDISIDNSYEDLIELLNNLSYHNYQFRFVGSTLSFTQFEKIKTKLLDINLYEKNKVYSIYPDGTINV